MAKKKPVPKLKNPKVRRSLGTPVLGQVILELSLWNFDTDPASIQYHADQIAKVLQINYGMQNFGVRSFGMEEEE